MNPIQEGKIWRVLHRLEAEDAEDHRTLSRPREERMFTLHPDTSRLVHIMIQATGSKRLVEIGAAYGYSTIWLTHAARITGGQLTDAFILGVADNVMPDAYIERVERVSEMVEEYGTYPVKMRK